MTQAVHNVVQLTDEEVCDTFVVRQHELDELLAHLEDDGATRHALVLGQRGMGKSLLLRRLSITVQADPELAAHWLLLVLPEELYQVTSIGELWLAALARLAGTLDDVDLAAQHLALQAERDPARLETLALQRLLAAVRVRGQRLLLLVENLDMLLDDQVASDDGWSLRRALQTEPDLLLVATAVNTFAVVEEAGEAFYGFFHRIELVPLDDAEIRHLWHELTGIDLPGDRAVPIRILTGGNPRLITVLARFARQPDLGGLRHDLELLIDEYTPYFKAIIEVLPPVERKVFITLADIWAPATAAEVAERTRMTSSQVSAHLSRLLRRGAVQVLEAEQGRQRYELTERLYNLYHLLRSPTGTDRVRALLEILVHLYETGDLERTVFPGLLQAGNGGHAPMDTLIASGLHRHLDEVDVWSHMSAKELSERLAVFEALLVSQRAELGDDHPDTLMTRQSVALIVGRTGDRRRALELYRHVLSDQERICGTDHPDTLSSRDGVAFNTGVTGDPHTALDLSRLVAADRDRILGPDHPRTLHSRHQVAYYTGKTGDPHTALDLYHQLAADRDRILGPDHPDTLTSRHQVAYYIGATGDPHTALDLYHQLAADRDRILGPDHPDTLTSRHQVAYYTGKTGDLERARDMARDTLATAERSLEPGSELLGSIRWNLGDLEARLLESSSRPLPREMRELRSARRARRA